MFVNHKHKINFGNSLLICASIPYTSTCCPLPKISHPVSIMGDANDNFSPDLTSCSVESLLSVPLRFIFRQTQTGDRGGGGNNGAASGNRAGFIFSKSECATLLRVSMASMRGVGPILQRSEYILVMLILTTYVSEFSPRFLETKAFRGSRCHALFSVRFTRQIAEMQGVSKMHRRSQQFVKSAEWNSISSSCCFSNSACALRNVGSGLGTRHE